ncbi:MAG TPA: BON domain-containing protein [Kiritimatiellia bacterium]|nr:BON domain-containing protein [Kiritimatiellia bacterium]HRZ10840.1 BON domain-containing protein [Kiritimatiellia bacterium]HSA18887.1 BON domain-containing protein [Kiritimatiellia bacterium]
MKASKMLILLGMAVVLGAGGCATTPGPADDKALADERLTQEVERRLEEDPVTAPFSFGVFVRDGVVIMEGAISSSYVRSRAIGIARATPGVQNVLDKLAPW